MNYRSLSKHTALYCALYFCNVWCHHCLTVGTGTLSFVKQMAVLMNVTGIVSSDVYWCDCSSSISCKTEARARLWQIVTPPEQLDREIKRNKGNIELCVLINPVNRIHGALYACVWLESGFPAVKLRHKRFVSVPTNLQSFIPRLF